MYPASIVTQKNVVITGFMGTGKTTVGREVADMLDRPFYDTDEIIQERTGMSIPKIFRTQGEDFFRRQEKDVLADLAQPSYSVIATGGGSLLQDENLFRVNQSGIIFCLEARLDVLAQRLGRSGFRPLLAGQNPLSQLRALLAARQDGYRRLPNHIDTSESSPREIAVKIIALYFEIIHKGSV